jgi:hypothetical protein
MLMIPVMTLQQRRSKGTLQRSKPQAVMTISLQQKPHGPIAKAADAVVENDCGKRFTHNNTSSRAL